MSRRLLFRRNGTGNDPAERLHGWIVLINLWKRASNLRQRIPEVRVSTRITQTCIAAKAPRLCPLWVSSGHRPLT